MSDRRITFDIHATLSNQLRDYDVGPDAMRWTPDAEEIEAKRAAAAYRARRRNRRTK